MKRSFFQAAVVLILLYRCTTWKLTKRLKKKLDGNYTRMLRAILNKSWRQHPTRHQLYGYLSRITKTIQVRWTRHAGHCWRSKDELISDLLQWTPAYGQAKSRRPARTYKQQLCEDTGCCPEDLLLRKFLVRIYVVFCEIDPQHHKFERFLKLEATILVLDFSKQSDFLYRGKIEHIILAYGLPKWTVSDILMLYKTQK